MLNAYVEHSALNVSGIILNAKTGGIKAMGSVPNFNLNQVPRNDIGYLQQTSKNSMVVDVYEPGSTFKLITLAAALNEGLTNENEKFKLPSFIKLIREVTTDKQFSNRSLAEKIPFELN